MVDISIIAKELDGEINVTVNLGEGTTNSDLMKVLEALIDGIKTVESGVEHGETQICWQ